MFTLTEELKFYLLARGLEISPDAERVWLERFGGPLSLSEYASTSGVCLYTTDDVWVNAPFVESFTRDSQAVLTIDSDDFYVRFQGKSVPVSVVPVPRYHETTFVDPADGRSYPYTNVGVTHTDRCRISPIEGCGWHCTFCDLPYEFAYRKKPKGELLRVIELAIEDVPMAHHVLISGGTPRDANDERWLDEVYAYIAENSPVPVDVMMPARDDFSYPSWLRSVGINTLSVNLEVNDPDRARRITPDKFRLYGRQHYLEYIETAVEAFGVGRVQSLLVFGEAIEPLESTLEGVRALVERGCIPVLSPFRPDVTTPLGKKGAMPPTIDDMKRVWQQTLEICDRLGNKVKPGPRCIPCMHNTLTFPDESSFYVPLGGDLTAGIG